MKLLQVEIVTMKILRQQGESNEAIAQRLGITEGAVRYHLRRSALQAMDGRFKPSLIEQQGLIKVVDHWWKGRRAELAQDRSPNAKALWEFLCDEYRYSGSYKSVQKYVANRYPKPAKRPFRRVETPPAAQVQSDWMDVPIRLLTPQGIELVTLHGFVMILSHSRKAAVVWSERMKKVKKDMHCWFC